MLSTGVAGHVFNFVRFITATPDSLFSSLRPIWHRVFVSRGWAAIQQIAIR